MEKQKTTRREYTAEFKQNAVRLITENGLSVAQVARDLGVNENMLHRWKQQLGKQACGDVDGDDVDSVEMSQSEKAELKRLRREILVLRQEQEILKKAVGIFSQLPR